MTWNEARDWMLDNPGSSLTADDTDCEWRFNGMAGTYQIRIGATWQRSSDFLGSSPCPECLDRVYRPEESVEAA